MGIDLAFILLPKNGTNVGYFTSNSRSKIWSFSISIIFVKNSTKSQI